MASPDLMLVSFQGGVLSRGASERIQPLAGEARAEGGLARVLVQLGEAQGVG